MLIFEFDLKMVKCDKTVYPQSVSILETYSGKHGSTLVGIKNNSPVIPNAVFSGNGSRLLEGQLFLMAPSDGVRRRLREELAAEGKCVGVRDWRGLRLKVSR